MLQMINLSPSNIFPLCEQRESYFTVAAGNKSRSIYIVLREKGQSHQTRQTEGRGKMYLPPVLRTATQAGRKLVLRRFMDFSFQTVFSIIK